MENDPITEIKGQTNEPKKNNNKTIAIVVIAALVLIACCLLSCCAGSLFLLSKVDSEELIEIINSNPALTQPSAPQEKEKKPVITAPTEEAVPETEAEEVSAPVEEETAAVGSEEKADAEKPAADPSELTEAQLKIIEEAETVRGLSSPMKFAPVYKTKDEIREYYSNEFYGMLEDEEFQNELGLMHILGFVPEDFDVKQFYIDLYTEQIAGFYDPETNDMYLVTGLSEQENNDTLAHEYTHFLQYNDPKIGEIMKSADELCKEDGEVCLIINALSEGDATLTETLMSDRHHEHETTEEAETDSDIFDNAPKYYQEDLVWSYVYGLDFVWYQYLKGGFDRINEIYENLPTSVEQILHPEKYGKDEPVDINIDVFHNVIEKAGKIIAETTLNEYDIYEIFASGYEEKWRLEDRKARTASEGWGGGSYIYGEIDGSPLLFSKTAWDSTADAKEAEAAFRTYNGLRFERDGNDSWKDSDGSSVYLIRQNDVVYWMILPENFEADKILDLINLGSAL